MDSPLRAEVRRDAPQIWLAGGLSQWSDFRCMQLAASIPYSRSVFAPANHSSR